MSTPYRYTGQREESGIGLYFYNARWYDPTVGRFIQPDAIVPEPGNPQAYNRYTYVLNNPVRYSDPSGLANDPRTGIGMGSGGSVTHGSLVVGILMPSIKNEAKRYGVPWQVVAGLLEAEIGLDTDLKDYAESGFFLAITPLAWTGNLGAQSALGGYFWLRPDPGPGLGNVHLSTAHTISAYYGDDPVLGLGLQDLSREWLAFGLSTPSGSVTAIAAYTRMLADYRFGSGGLPSQADHSDLAAWNQTDAVAIWHGYRYGVEKVSPGGEGFKLEHFQNRSGSIATTVGTASGNDKIRSMYGSIPYFKYYWGQR